MIVIICMIREKMDILSKEVAKQSIKIFKMFKKEKNEYNNISETQHMSMGTQHTVLLN